MNKALITLIICAGLAVVLILPMFIMSYGIIFGHNFSENQMLAASLMATVGILPALLAAFNWGEL